MRTRLEEAEDCPGFYMVPGHDRIAISREGMVYDLALKFCHFPRYEKRIYPMVEIPGYGAFRLHRLLAYTFLMPDDADIEEYHELIINHKNGVKHDHDIDNLEWCTYQDNSIHAYMTGLREDNRPVSVKDLRTDEIVDFYSLNEAARFFKVNQEKVHRYLKRKGRQDVPFLHFYEVIYKDEEWRGLTKDDIGRAVQGRGSELVALYGDRVIVFDSAETAGKHFNLSAYLIKKLLNEREKNGPLKIFNRVHYHAGIDNAEFIAAEPFERVIPKRTPVPIKVTDLSTGEVTDWESVAAFGHAVNVSKNTIQKSMSVKNGHWKNYHIVYVK